MRTGKRNIEILQFAHPILTELDTHLVMENIVATELLMPFGVGRLSFSPGRVSQLWPR